VTPLHDHDHFNVKGETSIQTASSLLYKGGMGDTLIFVSLRFVSFFFSRTSKCSLLFSHEVARGEIMILQHAKREKKDVGMTKCIIEALQRLLIV
jgi:hypothetical protein